MARTDWQYNEIVTEGDMNQLGQEVNAATQGVQNAKVYTDQQIALVTATGIPKLVTYPYVLTAIQAGQTDFEIPLETFVPETDTVIVVQNSTVLSTDRFSIVASKTVRLAEGVRAGTQIFLQVWKNVPIGPDGAISAAVLADGTVSKAKLAADVTGDYVRQPGYIDPTGGSSTEYTGGTNPPLLAYADGVCVTIVPHVDCGASPTFNWDGLGAVSLNDAEENPFLAGDLKAGVPYTFRKKGSSFILVGKGGMKITGQTELDAMFTSAANKGDPVFIKNIFTMDTSQNLASPTEIPVGGNGHTIATDQNGIYIAVGFTGVTPNIFIYKRSKDALKKIMDLGPGGNMNRCSFSTDGNYLAVVTTASPYLYIYKRTGDTFTKLTDPATLPSSSTSGVAFSPDGNYLAICYNASPYIFIYKRNGDIFTKLADPNVLPTTYAGQCTFSSDGNYLAVGLLNSPYIFIYKRNGDTFTKLADLATLPTGAPQGLAFSCDGKYLVVGHLGSPYITIYKISNDTFTKLADPSVLPGSNGMCVAISYDSKYVAVGNGGSHYILIYKITDNDTFTKLADPSVLPGSMVYGVAFSFDGNYLFTVSQNSPFIYILKGATFNHNNASPSGNTVDDIVSNYLNGIIDCIGYAKEAAEIGETKKVNQIWG